MQKKSILLTIFNFRFVRQCDVICAGIDIDVFLQKSAILHQTADKHFQNPNLSIDIFEYVIVPVNTKIEMIYKQFIVKFRTKLTSKY